MPIHTLAERKKLKKQVQDIFRRLAPGQLGKDILGKAQKDIDKAIPPKKKKKK